MFRSGSRKLRRREDIFVINNKKNLIIKWFIRKNKNEFSMLAVDLNANQDISQTEPEAVLKRLSVCCGVRGRASASHTDGCGFEPQCGGRLSSLTC